MGAPAGCSRAGDGPRSAFALAWAVRAPRRLVAHTDVVEGVEWPRCGWFEPGVRCLMPVLLSAGLAAVWGGGAGVWGEVLSTGV